MNVKFLDGVLESVIKILLNCFPIYISYIYKSANVIPSGRYVLSLQRKFVEKLAVHDNNLMNDIFKAEADKSWADSNYLSPVGIKNESIDDLNHFSTPFFIRKLPLEPTGVDLDCICFQNIFFLTKIGFVLTLDRLTINVISVYTSGVVSIFFDVVFFKVNFRFAVY